MSPASRVVGVLLACCCGPGVTRGTLTASQPAPASSTRVFTAQHCRSGAPIRCSTASADFPREQEQADGVSTCVKRERRDNEAFRDHAQSWASRWLRFASAERMVVMLNLNVRSAQVVPEFLVARTRCSSTTSACKPTVADPAVQAPLSFGRRPLLPAIAHRHACKLCLVPF